MADRPAPADRRRQIRLVAGAVLGLLVVVFAFKNRDPVSIDYIFFTRKSRLIYIILASAVLGAIAWALIRRGRAKGRERDDD